MVICLSVIIYEGFSANVAVLTDPAGENQYIHPSQHGCIGAYEFSDAVMEHIQRQLSARIAGFGSFFKLAHVTRNS